VTEIVQQIVFDAAAQIFRLLLVSSPTDHDDNARIRFALKVSTVGSGSL
jgi:hypothetical protein